jgi:hypothetical protein
MRSDQLILSAIPYLVDYLIPPKGTRRRPTGIAGVPARDPSQQRPCFLQVIGCASDGPDTSR